MGSVSGTKTHASSSKPKRERERALPLPPPSSGTPGNLDNRVRTSNGGDPEGGDRNPPPPVTTMASTGPLAPLSLDGSQEDAALGKAEFLTREEVLRRRLRRVRQLWKYYRDEYWCLMEEVRFKYGEYYWKYGKSPVVEEEEEDVVGEGMENGGASGSGGKGTVENGRLGLGFWEGEMGGSKRGEVLRCGFTGCKTKAMALTKYCHAHILSDGKQILYKPCGYVIKSAQTGPVTCGKPVLRAAVPSLCSIHLQKSQKNVSQALKRAGFNSSSSSRPPPKFHVIIAEYVRLIQAKRREIQRGALEKNVNGDGNIK